MKNNYYSLKNFKNIFQKPNSKSEKVSQLLYGEKFKIISKNKNWIKIKTLYDGYLGFIKNENFTQNYSPTHKISILKAPIFIKKDKKLIRTKNFLPFASKISILSINKKYSKFEKKRWVRNNDIKKIDHKNEKHIQIFKSFTNTKYKWGGKSFAGIDCSGLIQIFFYYNNIYCPRDTKKQLPYFQKKNKVDYKFKKNIIFWKGHVAFCCNRKNLIHAYGPKKKVVVMNIKKTVMKIFKDTKLKPIYI